MHTATVPTRIKLDGGPVIDVDPASDHLEVTISCAGRARAGIALTRHEARRLAEALLDASAPGNAPAAELEKFETIAVEMRPSTPAKAAATMRRVATR